MAIGSTEVLINMSDIETNLRSKMTRQRKIRIINMKCKVAGSSLIYT